MNSVKSEIDWKYEVSKIAHSHDELAFRLLFSHFYGPLVFFSTSLTNNQEISEDIVSDFMLKIWLNPEKFTSVLNIKTYLYKSVKNQSLNALERIKVSTVYLNTLEVEPKSSLNPESQLLTKELEQKIEQAISTLPPKSKMVFTLIRDNECTYAEAADILEISPKTVDRHLQISLHKIREFLKI